MFLVAGATGNVGSELVKVLVERGEPVRGVTRSGTLPGGAEAVGGDLNEPASLRDSLAGVRASFLLSGYADMPGLLREVRDAGVEHVVLLSSSSVPGGDLTNAVARYHIESEAAVKESGVGWTMLQPHSFMSNALRWVPQLEAGDVVTLPFADVAVATVDPGDIAAVAAEAMTSPESHTGKTYRVTGPEPLRPADQVRIVGEAIGRDLEFVAQSDEDAHAEMSASMPAEYVNAFFSFFVDGKLDESPVLPTVEEVVGRPPRTLGEWARANADRFPARSS